MDPINFRYLQGDRFYRNPNYGAYLPGTGVLPRTGATFGSIGAALVEIAEDGVGATMAKIVEGGSRRRRQNHPPWCPQTRRPLSSAVAVPRRHRTSSALSVLFDPVEPGTSDGGGCIPHPLLSSLPEGDGPAPTTCRRLLVERRGPRGH